MRNRWKTLSVAIIVLFLISSSMAAVLWVRQEPIRAELSSTRSELSTVNTDLQDVESQLYEAKSQLVDTSNRAVQAEYDLNQWLSRYYYFREQIYSRMVDGPSMQAYITPDEPAITELVEKITDNYSSEPKKWWKDVSALNHWVTDNIKYSADSYLPILPENVSGDLFWQRDFWKLPVETLEDMAGDCEDMSMLLASMLSNYSKGSLEVWIIEIQNENRRHIAVAYPTVDGLLTILDPAGNYYTWHFSWSELRAYEVAVVLRYWLKDWEPVMPGAQVVAIFNERFYMPFSSTQEFIDWFRASYAASFSLKAHE